MAKIKAETLSSGGESEFPINGHKPGKKERKEKKIREVPRKSPLYMTLAKKWYDDSTIRQNFPNLQNYLNNVKENKLTGSSYIKELTDEQALAKLADLDRLNKNSGYGDQVYVDHILLGTNYAPQTAEKEAGIKQSDEEPVKAIAAAAATSDQVGPASADQTESAPKPEIAAQAESQVQPETIKNTELQTEKPKPEPEQNSVEQQKSTPSVRPGKPIQAPQRNVQTGSKVESGEKLDTLSPEQEKYLLSHLVEELDYAIEKAAPQNVLFGIMRTRISGLEKAYGVAPLAIFRSLYKHYEPEQDFGNVIKAIQNTYDDNRKEDPHLLSELLENLITRQLKKHASKLKEKAEEVSKTEEKTPAQAEPAIEPSISVSVPADTAPKMRRSSKPTGRAKITNAPAQFSEEEIQEGRLKDLETEFATHVLNPFQNKITSLVDKLVEHFDEKIAQEVLLQVQLIQESWGRIPKERKDFYEQVKSEYANKTKILEQLVKVTREEVEELRTKDAKEAKAEKIESIPLESKGKEGLDYKDFEKIPAIQEAKEKGYALFAANYAGTDEVQIKSAWEALWPLELQMLVTELKKLGALE